VWEEKDEGIVCNQPPQYPIRVMTLIPSRWYAISVEGNKSD
jgi:hypothetical protein